MTEKQFPQLPKELINEGAGMVLFEHYILSDPAEMCSHDLTDLLFLVGADEPTGNQIFFDVYLSKRDQ